MRAGTEVIKSSIFGILRRFLPYLKEREELDVAGSPKLSGGKERRLQELPYLTLGAADLECIENILRQLLEDKRWRESLQGSFSQITIKAHELPIDLRRFLVDFRQNELSAGCIVSGLPVDDNGLGPTPVAYFRGEHVDSKTRREELWLVLCGSLLGDVFGWATQQGGLIVHDVYPVPGCEDRQIGSSSSSDLWWHTEDAFHPMRADYVGLLALRNADHAATTIASVADIDIGDAHKSILMEERFLIAADDSHVAGLQDLGMQPDSHRHVDRTWQSCRPTAVLTGAWESPYLTLDPFYMNVRPGDFDARRALDALIDALDACLRDVVLGPGELLLIDNFRAVHGRRPFVARYDGTDRWLKRINVTCDLRKSRGWRAGPMCRVIN